MLRYVTLREYLAVVPFQPRTLSRNIRKTHIEIFASVPILMSALVLVHRRMHLSKHQATAPCHTTTGLAAWFIIWKCASSGFPTVQPTVKRNVIITIRNLFSGEYHESGPFSLCFLRNWTRTLCCKTIFIIKQTKNRP